MFIVLVLAVLAAIALGVALLQRNQSRNQSRKSPRGTYFSHTLGVSTPPPAEAAEDETTAP